MKECTICLTSGTQYYRGRLSCWWTKCRYSHIQNYTSASPIHSIRFMFWGMSLLNIMQWVHGGMYDFFFFCSVSLSSEGHNLVIAMTTKPLGNRAIYLIIGDMGASISHYQPVNLCLSTPPKQSPPHIKVMHDIKCSQLNSTSVSWYVFLCAALVCTIC